jgi:hypothetical protein
MRCAAFARNAGRRRPAWPAHRSRARVPNDTVSRKQAGEFSLESRRGQVQLVFVDLNANAVSAPLRGRQTGGAGSRKWV